MSMGPPQRSSSVGVLRRNAAASAQAGGEDARLALGVAEFSQGACSEDSAIERRHPGSPVMDVWGRVCFSTSAPIASMASSVSGWPMNGSSFRMGLG